MKRIAIYLLMLGTVLIVPMRGTDVGQLHPVELVQLYKEEDRIVIATDTGAVGKGRTVEEAVANLNATTAGIVFLDTAQYLLLSESEKEQYPAMAHYLKPKVRVCAGEHGIDLHEAAAYLDTHRPSVCLKDLGSAELLQNLAIEGGRIILKDF